MTVRTVSNLPAAMHVEMARCLFAIELSKQSWVIGFITPLSAKISRRILSGCDWKGLPDATQDSVRGCSLGFTAAVIADGRLQRACKAQRSSNRTCPIKASGSPTGFTVRHTGSDQPHAASAR